MTLDCVVLLLSEPKPEDPVAEALEAPLLRLDFVLLLSSEPKPSDTVVEALETPLFEFVLLF